MVFSALTNERQLTAYNIRSYHDCDVAIATAVQITRGVFVENTANGGQYHWTARDTASRQVAGVAMETVNNTATTPSAPYPAIRVSCRGVGVFPVNEGSTAVKPDTALYVDGTVDGNTLIPSGNIQVARTICACRVDGEVDPTSTTYAWVDYDPKKY